MPSSPRFWVRLLSHRPLTVLGSLWLITICVAAVAAQRLVFNNPDRTATGPSPVQTPRSVAIPQPRSEANPAAADPLGATASTSVTALPRQKTKVTLWGFSSLVGLCALGSWVITQQAKTVHRRRVKRRVRRVRRVKPKPPTPTGPKRLRPYSPERDAVIVQGARAVRDTLPLTLADADGAMADDLAMNLFDDSVDAAQAGKAGAVAPVPRAPMQAPRPPRPSPAPPAPAQVMPPSPQGTEAADPHQPEVLPDEEAHPLDWEEDSLAHALDLRQRRSLSSLM
ncbi:hypothetical protein [Leptolyngbya sp. BL0902]|uniref:hypothetical protein n=1 Tax=Leptolyngbya sp. BL0902 TaxID=1115757 RepID=UPI0018E84A48|nr:hypothetical protein [Leptolyngbya sp. BL0902]